MTPELTVLALAGLLQALLFLIYTVPANRELGRDYTMGTRDAPPTKSLSQSTARLQRALNNGFEALILFTIAVVVVTLGNQSTGVTTTAAWIFLAARVLYVAAYRFGWTPWRSAFWVAGFLANVTMLIASLV